MKNISTEYGTVTCTANISYADNGQVLIHIVSKLGSAVHEHRVTVGSEDGVDAVKNMNEVDLQSSLQSHIDLKRNEAAQVLIGRLRTAKVARLLT